MQTENRFLDDLAKLASGALGTLQGARAEAAARFRDQLDRWLNDLDLVTREEFDAVAAMAKAARKENIALEKRIAALDAALGIAAKPAKKSAAKKAAPKKAAAMKAAAKKSVKKPVKKPVAKKAAAAKRARKS